MEVGCNQCFHGQCIHLLKTGANLCCWGFFWHSFWSASMWGFSQFTSPCCPLFFSLGRSINIFYRFTTILKRIDSLSRVAATKWNVLGKRFAVFTLTRTAYFSVRSPIRHASKTSAVFTSASETNTPPKKSLTSLPAKSNRNLLLKKGNPNVGKDKVGYTRSWWYCA